MKDDGEEAVSIVKYIKNIFPRSESCDRYLL